MITIVVASVFSARRGEGCGVIGGVVVILVSVQAPLLDSDERESRTNEHDWGMGESWGGHIIRRENAGSPGPGGASP